jgi:preprotein translocase subunit SecA
LKNELINKEKNLFDYDDILNKQRKIVYYERRKILESLSVRKRIFAYCEQIVTDIIVSKLDDIVEIIEYLLGKKLMLNYIKDYNSLINEFDINELIVYFFNEFWLIYQTKILQFSLYGQNISICVEKSCILIVIDKIWKEHLEKMTLLREAVGWRSYGQKNPLYEYKREAFFMFQNQKEIFRQIIVYDLLRSFIL